MTDQSLKPASPTDLHPKLRYMLSVQPDKLTLGTLLLLYSDKNGINAWFFSHFFPERINEGCDGRIFIN